MAKLTSAVLHGAPIKGTHDHDGWRLAVVAVSRRLAVVVNVPPPGQGKAVTLTSVMPFRAANAAWEAAREWNGKGNIYDAIGKAR